jgi:alpha,alpha-trehalose phosphorylase
MLHHKRIKPPPEDYPADEWNLIETRFHPEFLAQAETFLALSNGYLGMRGCPEEGSPAKENSTLINGFYETWPIVYPESAYGFAKTGQTIVKVTDSKIIKLFVDDEPFSLAGATIARYDRRLNMKAGTLDREILWETPSGKEILIKSRRLISFVHRHVAAIRYSVTVLNADAALLIASELRANGTVSGTDENDPRGAKASRPLRHRAGFAGDARVLLCHETAEGGQLLACAIDHRLETACPCTCTASHGEDRGQAIFAIEARRGSPCQLDKFMVYQTSETATVDELCRSAGWTADHATRHGFSGLLASQEQYLDDFWRRSDVRISGVRGERTRRSTIEIQQAIRFNLFHILQASARADGAGVPAKGLTGQAYEGHYFWDTEIYLLPFLIYTSPQIAKNLLLCRYRMLSSARARAKELGHRGAKFSWRTINGEEASAYYAAGTAQYHINADIMYALRKYVLATGDDAFLWNYGAEMLVETARFWLSMGFYSQRKQGKFCINGVTGPDEYKTVVNNNAFTNLMARENLFYAAQTIVQMRASQPDAFKRLVKKTFLLDSEDAEWMRAAKNMYVPYDEALKIIPQDDSFLDREPWDFAATHPGQYPLLLFFHPLNIYRKQVIKQADVVLAMFLLGDAFSLEEKKRNFDFYDPLTTGDSSLSSCVESIIAAQIGDMEKAIDYGMAALLMDLANVGGNVTDGCHIASMGGTWMTIAYGLGGMNDSDGTLSFRPYRAPEDNAVLEFPVTWRGQTVGIKISPDQVEYSLRAGHSIVIRHEREEICLTRENPLAVRPLAARTIPGVEAKRGRA